MRCCRAVFRLHCERDTTPLQKKTLRVQNYSNQICENMMECLKGLPSETSVTQMVHTLVSADLGFVSMIDGRTPACLSLTEGVASEQLNELTIYGHPGFPGGREVVCDRGAGGCSQHALDSRLHC